MKIYMISLAVGALVGLIYGLLHVRSPAPPVIALVGLAGILIGEQLPTLVKDLWHRQSLSTSWVEQQVKPHCFGELPKAHCAPPERADKEARS